MRNGAIVESSEPKDHLQESGFATAVWSNYCDKFSLVNVQIDSIQNLNIAISVIMNRDGTVREAKVMDPARMTSDAFFRISAEAARRAVLNPKCTPLKLPSEKFEQWKTMKLNFNPQDMF